MNLITLNVFRNINKCHWMNCPARSLFITPVIEKEKKSITEKLGLPNLPEKPQKPFSKFQMLESKNLMNFTFAERSKRIGEIWQNLPDAKKSALLKDYYVQKDEYVKSLEAYLSRLTPEQRTKLIDAASSNKLQIDLKKEKKKELEFLGKPKHPGNAFFLFLSTLTNEDKARPRKEFLAESAIKWKGLTEAQREKYKNDSKEKIKQYETSLLIWENKMNLKGRTDLIRKSTLSSYEESKSMKSKSDELKKSASKEVL